MLSHNGAKKSQGELLQTIMANDHKFMRAKAGVPAVCDLLCDSYFDPDADFDTFLSHLNNDDWMQELQDSAAQESHSTQTPGHSQVQQEPGYRQDLVTALPRVVAASQACPVLQGGAKKHGNEELQPQSNSHPPREHALGRTSSRSRLGRDAPSTSALAQRRYYKRQKAKQIDSEQHLSVLCQKMELLKQEKKELEVRNRNLHRDLLTCHDHVEELWDREAMRVIQQQYTLQLTADLIGKACGKAFSKEEAENWTVEEYATQHYQAFIDRQAELCEKINECPTAESVSELSELVNDQRDLDRKGGLSSCISWGFFCYNLHYTELHWKDRPSWPHWHKTLASLQLSPEQEDQILRSYTVMYHMLLQCAAERNNRILPWLGLDCLHYSKEELHLSEAGIALSHSFQLEQTAVLGFVLAIDKVLSTFQRACLETTSYPWNPEWLKLCELICCKRGQSPFQFPTFNNDKLDLPLLPAKSAFQALTMTMTNIGLGLRLQHNYVWCPYHTSVSRYCFPVCPYEQLKKLKLLQVMLGSWKRYPCWTWSAKVREAKRLLENDVVDPKNGS